jgi:DNA-binding MarR family transcriptional regulator
MTNRVDRLAARGLVERSPDPDDRRGVIVRLTPEGKATVDGAFAAHGMEQWEFDVLAALRRAGTPYQLSPGRLLRETLVTSGTMTNRVDRLSARGLVERYPDPDDRRGVIVRLTAEGKAAVDGAFGALLDAERALLEDLSERDQKKRTSLLRGLLAPFGD